MMDDRWRMKGGFDLKQTFVNKERIDILEQSPFNGKYFRKFQFALSLLYWDIFFSASTVASTFLSTVRAIAGRFSTLLVESSMAVLHQATPTKSKKFNIINNINVIEGILCTVICCSSRMLQSSKQDLLIYIVKWARATSESSSKRGSFGIWE